MNYEEMSDFEINAVVARSELWKIRDCEEIDCDELRGTCRWADGARWHVFDPCNNPSDAWPIINTMIADGCVVQLLESGVIVTLPGGGRLQSMGVKTLRAAMIVFLMMQEAV